MVAVKVIFYILILCFVACLSVGLGTNVEGKENEAYTPVYKGCTYEKINGYHRREWREEKECCHNEL